MSAHNHMCAPGLSTCAKLVQANLQVGVNSIILCNLLQVMFTSYSTIAYIKFKMLPKFKFDVSS